MKKTRVPRTCEYCNAAFEVQLWRFRRNPNEGRFCSIICHNKSRAGLPPWNKGLQASEEACRKNSEAHQALGDRLRGVPKSPEIKAKMSAYWAGRKRNDGFKEAMRRETCRRLQNGIYQRTDTAPERAVAALLDQLGVPFERQHVIAGTYVVDLFVPSIGLAIEADGDYWHAHPAKYPPEKLNQAQRNKRKRDKQLTTCIANRGLKLIRFWESDLLHAPSMCLQRLKQAIQEAQLTQP